MINFKTESGIFNFRVAGILIHRLVEDDFYILPGGRLEMMESTEKAIIREMKEELDIDIEVKRLLWICENFFNYNNNKYHEICFYYLIECCNKKLFDRGNVFFTTEDNKNFEFKWVSLSEIENEILYPVPIKKRLNNLPKFVERITEVHL